MFFLERHAKTYLNSNMLLGEVTELNNIIIEWAMGTPGDLAWKI